MSKSTSAVMTSGLSRYLQILWNWIFWHISNCPNQRFESKSFHIAFLFVIPIRAGYEFCDIGVLTRDVVADGRFQVPFFGCLFTVLYRTEISGMRPTSFQSVRLRVCLIRSCGSTRTKLNRVSMPWFSTSPESKIVEIKLDYLPRL